MASFNFTSDKKPLTVFGMAGLADIVLLLLIFFLLTSNFIPQFGIQVNLPQADTTVPTEAERVSVSLTKDGVFYVDGERTPRDGLLEAITQAKGTKTSLVLRPDRESMTGDAVRVMAIAKALNMRIHVATEREDLRPR
jgi:biopolymer transport protein ExbD